jgi:ribonuclease E
VPAITHDTVPEHAVAHEEHDGGLPEEDGSGQQPSTQDNAQFGEGEAREGGRRRRRRGRRGGRRNRQRNGEKPPFQGDATPESEAQRHDERPQYESEPVYAAPAEHRPTPPPEEPAAPASEQDAPRRRSTIREPVVFSAEGMPPSPANLPPSTPVISSSGADEQTAPKRGWWGKRLLGDKS